jgi:hypothetical protein
MIPFVATRSGLNVYVNGKMNAVGEDHPNYLAIREKCLDTNSVPADVEDLIDVAKSVSTQTFGKVTIEGETLKYEGREMHNALTRRIMGLLKEGQSIDIFVKFMENLMLNPSYRAVNELYGFLEACTLPITADGCFLAYKKVRFNYLDLHSGTFNNSVGEKPSMPRNAVDEDSRNTCSNGLHVCSFGYLSHFGGTGTGDADDRVVICKVNPKDVVAVPADYNNQKMRVSDYEVVDELPNDGLTQLVEWAYGKRDVAFIRDTLTVLKETARQTFDLPEAPKINDNLMTHDVTEIARIDFLELIAATFDLDTTADSYDAKYGKALTIKNLLQWVSNWS